LYVKNPGASSYLDGGASTNEDKKKKHFHVGWSRKKGEKKITRATFLKEKENIQGCKGEREREREDMMNASSHRDRRNNIFLFSNIPFSSSLHYDDQKMLFFFCFFLPSNKEKKKADVMMAPDVVEELQQHIPRPDFIFFFFFKHFRVADGRIGKNYFLIGILFFNGLLC
jgi:hypothetical protein